MQEKGDPVGGIVQEHQPLQETGQERGRLFHKHSQKHPGGRLEDTYRVQRKAWDPHLVCPLQPCQVWGSLGALLPTAA